MHWDDADQDACIVAGVAGPLHRAVREREKKLNAALVRSLAKPLIYLLIWFLFHQWGAGLIIYVLSDVIELARSLFVHAEMYVNLV